MVTKAVHLDLVSDLTANALIDTLKLLFARRGKISILFSDNATNFRRASVELKHLYKLVMKYEIISSLFASEGIKWKTLQPLGSLWEAGVKSFKYYLRKVVGPAKLMLEEFVTNSSVTVIVL
ncbi:integrase catalytic domain-containing protein [Trichonephila clavipes]|uniref:Integrase catalytic domain-containing protein n=1 Tax=Trichonephila clavipes TaxID=2585209 RepID=A0A8X6VDJ5_TRICX|nr:integrase catalytic domain-containing protein [Trichonephila clavipes]